MLNVGNMSYAGLGKAAGYARVLEFDDLKEWTTRIGEVLTRKGPALIVMETVPEITNRRLDPPRPPVRRVPEAAPVTRAALADRP